MTTTQQIYLDRLRAIRAPQQTASAGRRSGGGILQSLFGLGGSQAAPAPVTADQGPLPSGGNLYEGDPTGGTFSGGAGVPALALGNPNREQIKIGPFFRPRVDPVAAQALARDPLAPVQLEKPTTGVGGFFRRMLGDNANERNAALAEQQGQLRLQKWLMDQQTQGQMGVLDKQHQYAMERVKAQIEADAARQATADQTALQRVRLQDQNNIGVEGMRAVNDLIAKSQDQSFRARQGALERDVTMRGQDLTSEAAALRAALSQRSIPDKVILPEGSVYLNGQAYVPDENGKLQLFTGELGSGGFDPAAASARTRELTAAKAAQNEIENLQQPGTVLGGIGTVASDIGSAIGGAVGKAAPYVPGLSGLSALGEEKDRLFNYLRRIEEQKKARELMKRGLVNPIPTTE